MVFVRASVASSVTRWLLGVTVAYLYGCGGGADMDPEPVERTSVQKQCDSLMSAWCDSSLACVESGSPDDELGDGERADTRQLCIDGAKRTCDAALETGERYAECRASVETLGDADCQAIRADVAAKLDPSMPESCAGLFAGGDGSGGAGGVGGAGD